MSGGEAEEEDWFEKALQESDEQSNGSDEGDSADVDASRDDAGTTTEPSDSEEETADDPLGGDEVDVNDATGGKDAIDGDATSDAAESDPFDGSAGETDAEPFDGSDPDGEPFGGTGGGNSESDPFGGSGTDDSGGAVENAGDDDPFGGDAGGDTPDDDPFGGGAYDGSDAAGDEADQFSGATDDDPSSGGEDDPFGGSADEQADDGDDPFGGAQGSADADADSDPFGGGGGGGGDEPEADPFGGGAGGGPDAGGTDPFGGAQTDDAGPDDNPFGEDFADAMGGGDGDMGGGFGGGGNDPAEFEDEDFESEIDRLDIGIEGLDDMILGGVPIRSLMTVIGSAGTGKTTFGLQFLNQAMANGGSGVYITLEETEEAIVSTAEEKGWPFGEYIEDDKLVVVSMDPIEMANSLDSIRGDISRLVNNFGADRLVLDSVSLLEMMYDHPAKRRSEVFDFARSLKGAGVTTMLTSEANADNPYQSRHGLVEYLVDAVFVLQYVRPSDFQETRLAVEIQKIRDANHSRETKPYDITDEGISVYRQANIF